MTRAIITIRYGTYWLFLFLLMFFCEGAKAQDSVQLRIILLGNSYKSGNKQEVVLESVLSKVIPQKTIALFLGNNVYPRAIDLSTKARQNKAHQQLDILTNNVKRSYFLPGLKEWDNGGPGGFDKVSRLNFNLTSLNDERMELIPKDGCPGPFEVDLGDSLLLVALDTEWWLYPYDKHVDQLECECTNKREVLGKLDDILRRNIHKTILLATSHPFASYGRHGSYFSPREHIFPLATPSNRLYIPLPLAGSVYPFFRRVFPSRNDLNNQVYSEMIAGIGEVIKNHPNLIHVSAHEQSLQFIQNKEWPEIVSGAVSKGTPVKRGDGSLYAQNSPGYVVADVLADKKVVFDYYRVSNQTTNKAFTTTRAYVAPPLTGGLVRNESGSLSFVRKSLNKEWDKVGGLHRSLFGENYRKVWSAETTLPVMHVSEQGLTPKERGGGMQTHSLRLTDQQQKEWVFRSIEKYPESILPLALQKSFAADIVRDNSSAIFPYAPLTVPVFCSALGVGHSNPKIVYVAADPKLGIYSRDFGNTICLFEQREPLGKSLSSMNMFAELKKDNDNAVDQQAFLTARLLDIFLGDWDRHGDQWRWVDVNKGKGKLFKGVPRDRDQVFYVNQGLFLKFLALPWVMPKFQGFAPKVKNVKALSFNARMLDGILTNNLSKEQWHQTVESSVSQLSDSVVEHALQQLPPEIYALSHNLLSTTLKSRRQDLFRAMPIYYRFLNKTIDVVASDKDELVTITKTDDNRLTLVINKLAQNRQVGRQLFSRSLEPAETKEVRLYLFGGNDSVVVSGNTAGIKLRIIGDGVSSKSYSAVPGASRLKKIVVYEGEKNAVFNTGALNLRRHLSGNVENFAFKPTNRYNKTIPLLNFGYNIDDGFLLGGGVKWIRQGFRTEPYKSLQQVTLNHSFSTSAFKFLYFGEFLNVVGKTDFVLQAKALAPDNTQNFFGRGNQTPFIKVENFKRYYRTRFSIYQLDPAIRWRVGKSNTLSVGPSVQFYHLEVNDNAGRFILSETKTRSYDSLTLASDKVHTGIVTTFISDSRNNLVLPTVGNYIRISVSGYNGLNKRSRSFGQLNVDASFFRGTTSKSAVVFADRIGGGLSAGKTAFYQSQFLGGHDNLRGFRQYRYAGEHMAYNNFEVRVKLADVASYILPGQLGVLAFHDIGRVWQKNDTGKNAWHQSVGGGVYFAPANIAVIQFAAGYSKEGWYPYFSVGFRF